MDGILLMLVAQRVTVCDSRDRLRIVVNAPLSGITARIGPQQDNSIMIDGVQVLYLYQ